jgi:hypothetical protein
VLAGVVAFAAISVVGVPATGTAAAAAAPKLTLAASSPAKAVAPGATVRVNVVVRNRSRSAIRGVRLRATPARGVRVALPRTRAGRTVLTLGTLRAQSRRTIAVRLTPGAGTAPAATTAFTLSGRGQPSVTRRIRVKVGRSGTTTPAPAPAPAPTPANPLVGRYFFTYTGLEADGVVFVNDRFAYRGFPQGGFPACTAPTAADDDADGCVPYTFDAATGAIVLGGRPGSWAGGKLTLTTRTDAALSYDELQVPAPGSSVQFQGESLSSVGICPPSCTYFASGVTLYSDGQFALSTAVSSTTPDGGVTALPPDRRGTYAIQPGARLQLTFGDGHVAARTIAFVPNSDGTTSLFLDGTYYLP